MPYSRMFKDKMVCRMTGPDAISAGALSREIDVSQSTLSNWLRKAGQRCTSPESFPMKEKRPQDWTSDEKLNAIIEASKIDNADLGAFLREKGLHETHLEQWRLQILNALQRKPVSDTKNKSQSSDTKKIRELEKELQRKEAALAEAAALLILKKKARKIWGDEDGNTVLRSAK
jgi:transposase